MKHISCALISAIALVICATASHAALVPFTAMSSPNFSDTLSIYVPDGWTHRSAEGMMELKPPSGDGALSVEAGKLEDRTPTAWALLFSGWLHTSPTPVDGSTNCYAWSGKNDLGEEQACFFAASPEHGIYVHFTWTPGLDKTTEIAYGSRLAGAPLSGDGLVVMIDAEVEMIMAFAKWYDERMDFKEAFDPRIALSYAFADDDQLALLLDAERLEGEEFCWRGSTKVVRGADGRALGISCWYAEGGEYQHEMVGAIDAQGDAWVVLEVAHTPEPHVKLYKNGAETDAPAPRELEAAVAASSSDHLLEALAEVRAK